MSKFIEDAIAKAGLLPVLSAHRAGDRAAVLAALPMLQNADLLVLGAVADILRAEDSGQAVHIYEQAPEGITWVALAATELDTLRAVALARITGSLEARIGVDWSQTGMELAQVALGFGASDWRGPITRRSGLPILEDEVQKVKGQGMVEYRSIKKKEIADLVTHAGRQPVFEEDQRESLPRVEVQRV